ncbi:methyltransferase domain-containing protein [Kibdelosporangium persicum]|uniref:Demethylrebeccamycin-D-glucose O-methyltransferase n=1 Tax=Kibdelosporangium persicum TaxID=2698649 RepID=A0ABX2EX19_9PSEU|nr:methyltransferase domain-containing protein [Kibdelosporangium persicum]NRN63255.1 Demethylrebeccamycin-D-glucose O-methyltransferase [Kibdelosporangium persicum]
MSTSLIPILDLADSLPGAPELRARTYELLDLPEGAPVVDVGCGTGRAVDELAALGAGPIGVDVSPQMIEAAKARWPHDFRVGDAYDLPVRDVLGYRADKVLHALDDPARAVAEAYRVLAPGGRIVLVGQDWDTFVIASDDPSRTRQVVHDRADAIATPHAARHYRNYLLDNGFQDVAVEVHTMVWTDPAVLPVIGNLTDDQDWQAEQAERARTGRLFLALPMFVASATRPDESGVSGVPAR